jgi:transcriptional regulator with XRE-family HTH domain
MTINNRKLKLIENSHSEKTMDNLSKLLKDNDMSQVELAKKTGRDKTTVNRWVKNNRDIVSGWSNAVDIAKVLKCHPVDVINGGKSEIVLKEKCNWDGKVWKLKKAEQYIIPIFYECNHKDIKVVLIEARGTPNDGEIWLFNINGSKKFNKNSLGKDCYLEGKNIKPMIALLHPTGDGKLSIINTFTGKALFPKIDPYDLDVAAPVKVKYDPE